MITKNYVLINKKFPKSLKEVLLKNKLYLKDGALIKIIGDSSFSMSRVDYFVLIKDKDKAIGWGAVLMGFSHLNHHEDQLPTYPHLAVFITPKYRKRGIAKLALNKTLSLFLKYPNDYSFKEIGHSSPAKLFSPVIKSHKLTPKYYKGLRTHEIVFEFG